MSEFTSKTLRKLSHNAYVAGWICPLEVEQMAAWEMLDEEHEPLPQPARDHNVYKLGSINGHNLVIAGLHQPGNCSAATVITQLRMTFLNIEFCLLVGIGGGVPVGTDEGMIRLGHVVVAKPTRDNSGTVQYDHGKALEGRFERTGALAPPPAVLLNAAQAFATQRARLSIDPIWRDIERIQTSHRKLCRFRFPGAESDQLCPSDYTHRQPGRAVDDDGNAFITVHRGTIASAELVINDAFLRDQMAQQHGVVCFETEAVGALADFPCMIVRGISDYCDSHKNDVWHGFAAAAAAAYARQLFSHLPIRGAASVAGQFGAGGDVGGILSGLHEARDVAKEQLQVQRVQDEERQARERQTCHQLFRLTAGDKDATYEWYKDRVEERIKDTCLWFLKHKHFKKWLKQESGPLLVSADPGCGKSVLAKYLIDHSLPRSATICYFFFKHKDQNTMRQALCVILHQLFSQRPPLINHAMPQFYKNGERLIRSTKSLWTILENAVQDPQAGAVILVLDALDECGELEFTDLMRHIESQFRHSKLVYSKLRYLLTCRPYKQIISTFRGYLFEAFPDIRIPGEDKSEAISQEVNRVITHRVNQLSKTKSLSPVIKKYLKKRLQETTHRAYLRVYLVFDYLEKESFQKTQDGIKTTLATLPRSVNEAYEQILDRSKQNPIVRKALSIIMAASRPLTLSEINIAASIPDKFKSTTLELEGDQDFKLRLRSWCGLFISIHHNKIYFLHQTAREFLLAATPAPIPLGLQWHQSITIRSAHYVLAKACVLYLNLLNLNRICLPKNVKKKAGHFVDISAFLDYSAKNWGAHFRKAGITDGDAIMPCTLGICHPISKSYSTWFRIYWKTRIDWSQSKRHWDAATERKMPTHFTHLLVASYFGHGAIVKLLLKRGATDLEAKDGEYNRTALWWAARNEHVAVVKLLLEQGANIEATDAEYDGTPILWAAEYGHDTIVKLLLEKGAYIESRDKYTGSTPLSRAAQNRHLAIAKLLLKKGADIKSKDKHSGWTPLSWAVVKGHEAIVKLLLEKGANVESKHNEDRKPLSLAKARGHEAIAKLLLESRVVDKPNNGGSRQAATRAKRRRLVESKYYTTLVSRVAKMWHRAIDKFVKRQSQ
ncbi:hypothetical protein H634G_06690 [Metarhizium anisopliae BRIP 53293]|uniref:Uncharacterized protein n=1 Tax=Metarhizium anisopliae BRIP 53293 TaxID=1291518 RepID=A0A0D9NVQ2_METAN|nr:hypothetical protein H634G_06690 [Metarhizium anisopliae BRIP 53293]KJK88075.1 hypothetical protein H633G_08070 [Metarhizium anisopliae BRIP 53284]